METRVELARAGKEKAGSLPDAHRDWLELLRWLGYRVERPGGRRRQAAVNE